MPSLGDRVISGSVLALSRHLELLFLTGTSDLFLEPSGNTDIRRWQSVLSCILVTVCK